ncbi:MAG: phosphate propanoyltransferase, partial [Desulfuromusa sp.]|nr:phosphate propanoyltransferase [Desulfuromusa sp.]
ARHVHLSADAVQKLFGKDLTPVRELSQPGQYLSQERVQLIGPAGKLDNIAILGPARGKTQVEISATDARVLGLTPPTRQSGDTAGSAGLKIATEMDTLTLKEGLIIAARHLHMHPDDASRLGVSDKDLVRIRVGDIRALVFEEVLVRVNENYRLAMHIDFDEGNACGWTPEMTGQLL